MGGGEKGKQHACTHRAEYHPALLAIAFWLLFVIVILDHVFPFQATYGHGSPCTANTSL